MGRRWSVKYNRLVLDYAEEIGSDAKSYREFDVPKSTFYEWKKIFKENGAAGLIPKKPIAKSHPRQLSSEEKFNVAQSSNVVTLLLTPVIKTLASASTVTANEVSPVFDPPS